MKNYESRPIEAARRPLAASPALSRQGLRVWSRRLGLNSGLLFILPALLIYGGVVVYPLLSMFYLSAFSWDGVSPHKAFVGLANFQQLLVNQRLRGRTVFRTIYFLPGTVSVIVVGQVWGWIYQGDYGVLNYWLGAVGLESLKQSWLGDPGIAIYAAAIVALWAGVGFPMMVYLAGLQTIPHELLEAAQVDGATTWQRFRRVTFPLLLPQTVTLSIL